jgi:glutamate/tyrosine decarboxylase-like PLP-dependent enzyme
MAHESLLMDAARRAARYLDDLPDRPVAPSSETIREVEKLGGSMPEDPCDPLEVIRLLDEIGSPATTASAGPRFFGFVIGGSLPVTMAANWLAAAWDQNGGVRAASPMTAELEDIVLDWLRDVLRLPRGSAGALVTGATMGNFTALAAARHSLLAKQGWDVEAQGLFGAPPLQVVVGEEVHASMLKALSMIGFGRERVVRVPVDDQGRMNPGALPAMDDRTIVCIQAGNVNTGAFDPAVEICAAAHEAGAWVHVDGAFGLWARASEARSDLARGFGDADSWSADAHKWLNVPYDSGIAFVREAEAMRAAMVASASYLVTSGGREPHHYTPEMSRRARSIEIWAALKALGRKGIAALVDDSCALAERMARRLDAAGHSILNDVVLNQVLVSFGDDELTRRTIAAVQDDGTCWCGGTDWNGRHAMRISVSCWATTEADIDRSASAISAAAERVRGRTPA